MSIYSTIIKRRTIRRFKNEQVPYAVLERCVNAARLAPSSSNLQPCEYIIVDREDLLDKIFPNLKWAGYISPQGDPPPGERPRAYIVVLVNKEVHSAEFKYDIGMAVENMISTALEEGIGSCCIGAFDAETLRKVLNVPHQYTIDLVVALGYPNEKPIVEEFKQSVKYWKDGKGILHVPKRSLKKILHRNTF